MFSGIVEKIGRIVEFKDNILVIQEEKLSKELNICESIAINGICLTVISKNKDQIIYSVNDNIVFLLYKALHKPSIFLLNKIEQYSSSNIS